MSRQHRRLSVVEAELPLRLLCAFMLFASPLMTSVAGCNKPKEDGPSPSEDRDGDGLANDSDNCPDMANPDQADFDGNGIGDLCDGLLAGGLAGLARWWVAGTQTTGSTTTWGAGQAAVQGPGQSPQLHLEIALQDGNSATLTATLNTEGGLEGTWTESGSGTPEQPVDAVLYYNPAQERMEGTAGDRQVTLYPVSRFEQSDVGVYQRDSDDATLLLALDVGFSGNTALLSVLAPDGSWPEEGRYKGELSADDPRIEDLDISAFRFDRGDQLYACLYDSNLSENRCDALRRAATQSELNGAWLGGNKNYDNFVEWSLAVVVEQDSTLYIHERHEDLYDTYRGLDWALRAPLDAAGDYRDTDHGYFSSSDWVGQLSDDHARIIGYWEDWLSYGWEGYYHSLERTVEPPVGYLTGDASSVSADWFDAPSGIPEPIVGSAQLVQDGTRLSITDHSSDGETYQIEAHWTGYQYEGAWWNVTDPDTTSPWRGQLRSGGWYLHGTWEKGEYSFSLVPYASDADVTSPPAGIVIVSPDSWDNTLATLSDPDNGIAGTLFRAQNKLSGMEVFQENGDRYVMHLDDRLRPTLIEGPDQNSQTTYEWASDSSSVVVSVDDGSTTTTQTIQLALDDPSILAAVAQYEQANGLDLSELKTWITDHPGWIGAILSGQMPVPALLGETLSTRLIKSGDPTMEDLINVLWCVGGILVIVAATGGLVWCIGLFMLAIATGWYLGKLWMSWNNYFCDPCTLLCFRGCPP